MNATEGQLFDLGYRGYDGPREGRSRARKALFVNGIRTSFGIGRGALAKILPILFFGAVMAPAVVFVIIAATVERTIGVPVEIAGHADYYEIIGVILFLFAAIIAPELLCADRRDGVINLYLTRPLTFTDYVLGRWAAFFAVSVVFIYAGQVVLLVGLTMSAPEPLDYLRDNWADVPRFLAAGLVIAALTTTIPLAVAAFTTRRVYASTFIIGLFLITSTVAGIAQDLSDDSDAPAGESGLFDDYRPWLSLAAVGDVPVHLSDMIFGKDREGGLISEKLPDAVPIIWYIVVVAGSGWLLWDRYRRIVT